MKRPFISLSSDFGVQSQGIGIMEATVLDISPDARVIHLMHGLPDFDVMAASRAMETTRYLPVGCHVCVVDPGVGTKRKGIIIKTKRGDHLIGPDNGVLISAANILGGYKNAVEITNPKYMKQPVSPIFHGRDVFSPAAAHISKDIPIEGFGKELEFEKLVKAPYDEAVIKGDTIEAQVININKFGSLTLNILASLWDRFRIKKSEKVILAFKDKEIELPFTETFGDAEKNKPLILKDDYVRMQVSVNMGNFSKTYNIKTGDRCTIKKS